MPEAKVNLCPTFAVLAKTMGRLHPNHVASNPVVPYYSYSMNSYLPRRPPGGWGRETDRRGGSLSQRNHPQQRRYFLAEENMWSRPGNVTLNDNALCPDARDWFGTFHALLGDWNGGTINAVRLPCRVGQVGLADAIGRSGGSQHAEFGRFEKFTPHAAHRYRETLTLVSRG
jgi:hypothetical protein